MDELKPCPFCGSQAEHRSVTDVEGSVFYETGCTNEKCCAWRAAQASTPQGSIRAWNARHESSVVAADEREEMSPDFTDSARAAIAWVLYHHQGGSSPIGQLLRFALGMDGHERLQDWRIAEAKRWAQQTGATTDRFHQPAERVPDAWRQALERALPFLDDEAGRYEDDGNNEPLDVADTIRDLLAAATSPEVRHG